MKRRPTQGAAAALVAATLFVPVAEGSTLGASGRLTPKRYAAKAAASKRGRPRKFDRPSRAVTLTLPTDVIAALSAVDGDLSRAVVRVAEGLAPAPAAGAELQTFDSRAIITVPRNGTLKERTGIELVPLSHNRALISFDERLTASQLELRLLDALADTALEPKERETFEALAALLRQARHAPDVELRHRQIIVLHRRDTRRA